MSAEEEEYPEDFGDDTAPAANSASSSLRERDHHVASPQQPQPHDIDDPELVSSLVLFATNGEEEGVRVAVDHGISLDAFDAASGDNAVLAACRHGHLRVVKMLYGPALPNVYFCNILRMYAAGANMDATNAKTKENTASLAVKSGNSALLQFLLDRGVANVSRKSVMTPLGGFPTKKSRSLVSPRTLKATTVQLGQVIKKTDKDSTRLQLLLNVENKLMGLDIAQLQKLWSTVDVNGNNLVSQGELTNFVTRHFPELDWKIPCRVAFLFADKSKDGLISKKEFRMLLFTLLWTNKAFEALNISDADDNAIITFEEFSAALQRLQFSLEEAGVRALFQSCARGGSGMMFGEFCAWYVSSQLETAAHSKLGPLQLPTDRKSEQQRRPQQSPENPQSKPRSSSANNGRVTPNQENGERAHKQPRTGREGVGGSDKDKLQAIYSAAPRPKHQSVWTKENLLRGSSSRKAQEPESVKDMRASVSHDIRQLASLSSMLASAAPVEFRRGGLPPTLDPSMPKNQNLRKSMDSQLPAAAHAHSLANQFSSISSTGVSTAKLPKVHHVGQQQQQQQQQQLRQGSDDQAPRSNPPRSYNDARAEANDAAVRERLAVLSHSFAIASAAASNMTSAVTAMDRVDHKQRKPPKPAANAVPLGRLSTERSSGSVGGSVKGDNDWDEPDNGLINLENFDQNGSSEGVILTSPRSIEVLRQMGVLQTELLKRDKTVYAQEVKAEGKELKFADMRFEHFERRRQELLQQAQRQRRHNIMRARRLALESKALTVIEEDGAQAGQEVAKELSSESKAATDEQVESSLVKNERLRVQRAEAIERKRIEKQLAHALDAKESVSELKEKLHNKEIIREVSKINKVNALVKDQVASQIEFLLRHKAAAANNEKLRMEAISRAKERKESAMKRLEQLEQDRALKDQEQHQRFEEQHKRMQIVRQNREEQERLAREHTQKRMETHQQRYSAVQEERHKELEEAAEVHRLKEEGKKYTEERTKRVQEYNRQCLINKIEKEKQRLEKMTSDVEQIKQKRSEEHKRLSYEKKKLQDAMNEFMRTGVWKKPEGVEIGPDSLLGVADDELKILSQTDRLPEAPLVANHESVRGTVEKDAYKYFKLKVEGKQSVVKIKLAALHGDPDLYVGNGRCPRPIKGNCTWNKSGHGGDVLTIYYFDARFAPGFVYIGVHGATDSEFSLKVVWKDVDILGGESVPSPGPSRLGNGTPALGEKKDAARAEKGQSVLPKILNPTKANPLHAVARDLLKNVDDASIVEDVVGKFQQWRS